MQAITRCIHRVPVGRSMGSHLQCWVTSSCSRQKTLVDYQRLCPSDCESCAQVHGYCDGVYHVAVDLLESKARLERVPCRRVQVRIHVCRASSILGRRITKRSVIITTIYVLFVVLNVLLTLFPQRESLPSFVLSSSVGRFQYKSNA